MITLPFLDTNVTINQLISIFEQIALDHAQINSFGYGQNYDRNALTIQNYPLLWVWAQPSKIKLNSILLVFQVTVCDLVRAEGTSTQQDEVQSDTISVLRDIVYLLRDKYDLLPEFDVDVVPFTESDVDRTTGWTATINIEVPYNLGICDVPTK
jgi:hypothetical protein